MTFGKTCRRIGAALVLALLALPAQADSYRDTVYGFSVDYPSDWTIEARVEGEDRVLVLTTPDGNASAQIRAVRLPRGVDAGALRQVFAQAAIPEAVLVGSKPETFAGLDGEVAAYNLDREGYALRVGGFFAVNGPVGYVLMTVTPAADFERRTPEIDAVLNTFRPGDAAVAYAGETTPVAPPAAGPQATPTLLAESHPELGFVLYRYATWEADQPAPYSVRVGPADVPRASRPSITVESIDGAAYLSLQAAAEDLKGQLADLTGIRFDQEGPHRIDNMAIDGKPLEGWSFGAVYQIQGVTFRQLAFLFRRESPAIYHFVYVTGPATEVVARQAEMMHLLQAISLVPLRQGGAG